MFRSFKGPTLVSVAAFSLLLGGCATTSSNGSGIGGGYNSTGGSSGSGSGGSAGQGSGGATGQSSGGSSGSGSGGTASGGTGAGGSTGGTSGGGSGGTGGGKCSSPGTLHSNTIYCPFSATGSAKNVYGTPGSQHCCEGLTNADLSVCQPSSTACTSGWTDWVCQKDSDCGSGQQCCAAATFVQNTNTSCANYATGFHATKCETTCASGEIHMCTANSDCASGKTCTPFSTKGAQVGACE